MLLSERVALITGGAKGMGRGMALKFAEEGCSVAVADISIKDAEDTIAEVSRRGKEGLAIKCDVTDGSQVRDAVDSVIKKFGKMVILLPKDDPWSTFVSSLDQFTDDFMDNRDQPDQEAREKF